MSRTDWTPPLAVARSIEMPMPAVPPPVKRALNVVRLDSKFSEKTTAGSEPMPLSRTYFAAIPTCANPGIGRQQSIRTHIPHQRLEKYANIWTSRNSESNLLRAIGTSKSKSAPQLLPDPRKLLPNLLGADHFQQPHHRADRVLRRKTENQ